MKWLGIKFKISGLSRIILMLLIFGLSSSEVLANYQAAQQLMARRDYVGAAAQYFQAYSSPRSPSEKIYAEWGLGKSLQALGFYYSSSKYFSQIIRRGRSPGNPYFVKALEELAAVNAVVSIGQSHVTQLFKSGRIPSEQVPGPAKGFYFYYMGVESFSKNKFEQAADMFRRVPSGAYYGKAQFHLGVIANRAGSHSRAVSFFENVRRSAGNDEWLKEMTNLNIARVHYEKKDFTEAMQHYALIPRESDNWLGAIFESAWAFFLMQKHNNVLGNIHTLHSPFFENRFFPESFILQSITYLRLCRYDEVERSLEKFRDKYKNVFGDLRGMINEYKSKKSGLFALTGEYRNGSLRTYKSAWAILDALSRTDAFKEGSMTSRVADNEIARLGQVGGKWSNAGLTEDLKSFLAKKKKIAITDSSDRLFELAQGYLEYLKSLSDQTKLIQADMYEGRVDAIRRRLNVTQANDRKQFIGGLQPLEVNQQLEYWPFQGEYWEDELGYYVYNIDDKCREKNNPIPRPETGK
jgi:tetratricopeptide (TPR) repeat protein